MNRRQFLATTIASSVAYAACAAEDDRKLRVAVIGHTGHGDYGHGLDVVWLRMPEVEIVGVADADAAGLAKAQKKLKLERGFADYRQMLTELKPEIVAVAPRHLDEHRDMTLAAIEAGARGIYIEKPFCRTPVEADEIIAAADKRKVKIAIAHRNRYHPALPAIERMLKDNALGQLLEIRMRGKEDLRGGAQDLWVLGAHLLNIATFFGGAPQSCTATLLQDGHPATKADVKDGTEGVGLLAGNAVHARFDMERGMPVFFDSIAKAGAKEAGFGLQLIGTKGIIDLRFDTEPLAQLLPGNPFAPGKEARAWVPISSAGPGVPEPIADVKEQVSSHLLPARDLIAAMREDRAPLCSAADGRAVVEMIMAVFESHRLNGQRVTFPLATRQNPLAQMA
ncbi:MAG: Gfo/Idh/MocA family oxidoreductase [Chthoniobacter sp.]|uniref:Gfo/Idh/MocA family protein n=1 Tax=Chthoniobacter sp. TaxID=2510640 RepID=UPI0032A3CDFA